MNFNEMDKLVKQHEGDIYMITKTIEMMNENIKELFDKYESLLNKINDNECQCKKNKE
jgi:hypothetical protein